MNMGLPHPFNEAACTVDHVLPKSQGHGYWKNSVASCYRCNHLKGDLTVEGFLIRHGERIKHPPTVVHRFDVKRSIEPEYLELFKKLPATKRLKAPDTIIVGATSKLGALFPPGTLVEEE